MSTGTSSLQERASFQCIFFHHRLISLNWFSPKKNAKLIIHRMGSVGVFQVNHKIMCILSNRTAFYNEIYSKCDPHPLVSQKGFVLKTQKIVYSHLLGTGSSI